MNNKLKNCVAYMRFSSDNQKETSIEYQRAEIQKYCATNGLTVLCEYVDRAQSATTDQRDAFQKMMADALEERSWDQIVIYDYSRFSRRAADAFKYTEYLARLGIGIISVTERLDNSPEGKLMQHIKFSFNQYFSDHNAAVTRDGQKAKAAKGQHCGGTPPLGYDLDKDGYLVINKAEAAAVKKIYEMYLNGHSYATIATFLNDAGYRTKTGGLFGKGSFSSILHQEKYTGTYVWNRATAKYRNVDGKKCRNNHASKPEEEQVRKPNGCPAIISKEDFDKVQQKLRSRSRERDSSPSKHLYVLGGLGVLKCGCCGRHMVGTPRTCRGRSYITYRCPNHKEQNCPTKELKATELDKLVVKSIVANSFRRELVSSINKLLGCVQNTDAIEHQLLGVDRSIKNLTKSLEIRFSEALVTRLEILEEQKSSLEAKLDAARSNKIVITEENFDSLRKQFYKYLLTSPHPMARDYLKTAIKEIKITNEKVSFTLNVE